MERLRCGGAKDSVIYLSRVRFTSLPPDPLSSTTSLFLCAIQFANMAILDKPEYVPL